jgi:hypothetical protein
MDDEDESQEGEERKKERKKEGRRKWAAAWDHFELRDAASTPRDFRTHRKQIEADLPGMGELCARVLLEKRLLILLPRVAKHTFLDNVYNFR